MDNATYLTEEVIPKISEAVGLADDDIEQRLADLKENMVGDNGVIPFIVNGIEGEDGLTSALDSARSSTDGLVIATRDLMEALNAIRNRSETTTQFSLPAQEGDNYLKKNGVQVTSTSRVKVLYIPVGKKDAIIVGVVFSYGKQFQLRDHDDRVRRYQGELNRLKANIESGNATRDMEISSETDKRIEKALKNETKKSSLRTMFEENEPAKKESNGNGKK